MQVTELSAQGLKREYKITVPADEIADRVTSRLQRLQQTIRMPGFRPGKAPLPLLRKQYGRSVMGEVLEEAVDQGARQAVEDRQLRPALRPKVEVTSFDEGKDLEFKVDLEVLPEVPEVDLAGLQLTKLVADVDEARVEQALDGLAKARQKHEPLAEPRPSQEGDELLVDFEGKVGGEPFEGGSAKDFTLVLGSKTMVPGFEDQLTGVSAGDRKEVTVTFPADFPRAELAGKEAVFDVTVKEVRAPVPYTLDDAWAKDLGEETVEGVRNRIRERLQEEYTGVSRMRQKRQLLDELSERYAFPVPEGMVEIEFELDLEAAQGRDGAQRLGPRRGRQERGRAQGRVPQDRRAARTARAAALRHRQPQRRPGDGRGAAAGGAPRGDALPRPGAAGARVHPQQPGGARANPGPGVRGQGRRPRLLQGPGRGADGPGRGAAARSGRGGRASGRGGGLRRPDRGCTRRRDGGRVRGPTAAAPPT